jgi:hypothetical protein
MLLALACFSAGVVAVWKLSGDPQRYAWWRAQSEADRTIPGRVIYTGLILGTAGDVGLGTSAIAAYLTNSWWVLLAGVSARILMNAVAGYVFRSFIQRNADRLI